MFMKIPLFYNKVIKGGDRMENILLIENITKYYGNKTNITKALEVKISDEFYDEVINVIKNG